MSIQPELLAPDEFPEPFAPAPDEVDGVNLVAISIGISAGYLAWRLFIKDKLLGEQPRSADEAEKFIFKMWNRYRNVWLMLSSKPIIDAYKVIPYTAAEKLAIDYATELGEYIHKTSADALLEGFASQINSGVGEGLSWSRAANGYGLDTRQMKTYITQVSKIDHIYGQPSIPPSTQAALDRAAMIRADRLGQAESFKAVQVGKNMIWMAMQASGDLPPGAMKKWITADDERVCPVCGPLDQMMIPMYRRFRSGEQRFYAPTVHPNCRCRIEIVYPDLGDDVVKSFPGDPHNRNKQGEFASKEERAQLGGERKLVSVKRTEKKATVFVSNKPTLRSSKPLLRSSKARLISAEEREALAAEYADISEELEAAATEDAPAVSVPDWNYDSEVLIPGSAIYQRTSAAQNYEDMLRLLIRPESAGTVITIKKTKKNEIKSTEVWNYLPETKAFKESYEYDVRRGMDRVTAFNQDADKTAGGRADRRRIAVGYSGKDIETMRTALSGLNRKQLLYVMQSAIEESNKESARIFIDPTPHSFDRLSTREILAYWETQNVNDVATAIIEAVKEEQTKVQFANYRDWTHAMKNVIDAHNAGHHHKMRQFRGAGDPDYRTATPIIFRLANGWMPDGDYVSGQYKIANTRMLPRPKLSYSDVIGSEYVNGVLIVDLIPAFDDIRRKNLHLTN